MRASKSDGAGSANVTQRGDFSVSPAVPIALGNILFSGARGVYTAKFKLMWNGNSIECTASAGNTL